ncbi:Opsin, ultraviolet-sensitive [Armadillidium nasatum]|uniref:Opsin, ultraviolet-sensitive n=1 Tax=Armadillidium nasatum TaxID=96803 RepID=A0A5N5TL28_9CRUS|nr:Opsin, ultraviolet-sensitive [Armadillidium nasatum]
MLGIFYIFFMCASLVGNGVVIWIFSRAKSLRTPSNMLVINLAIFDFIMMLKTPVFIINSFNEGPVWGKFGCDIFGLMGAYAGVGGAVTNAAIAYDRYRRVIIINVVKTIAKPFEGRLTRSETLLYIGGIWVYATPWAILPLLGIWGRFVPVNLPLRPSFKNVPTLVLKKGTMSPNVSTAQNILFFSIENGQVQFPSSPPPSSFKWGKKYAILANLERL